MKKAALSGLAALTLFDIAGAQAQTPPVFNWSGFYVGGHAGYRWAEVSATALFGGLVTTNCILQFDAFCTFTGFSPSSNRTFELSPNSGIAGFQAGYNFQINTIYVIGVEGDVSWGKGSAGASFSVSDPLLGIVGNFGIQAETLWSASLRARFGVTDGPWFFYGTVGVSFMEVALSGGGGFGASLEAIACDALVLCIGTATSASAFSSRKLLVAPTFGFGLEHMLPASWMVRFEYLVADYGRVDFGPVVINSSFSDNFNCFCTVTSTSTGTLSATVFTQVVRLGLSKKFP